MSEYLNPEHRGQNICVNSMKYHQPVVAQVNLKQVTIMHNVQTSLFKPAHSHKITKTHTTFN